MKINETIEKVRNLLEEKLHHSVVVEQYKDLPAFTVHIEWGDWKHEHACAKYLIKSEGLGTFVKTIVTDSDGSDCYSATHYFVA